MERTGMVLPRFHTQWIGADWKGVDGTGWERTEREGSGAERNGMVFQGPIHNGEEWNGLEGSGVERRGKDRNGMVFTLSHKGTIMPKVIKRGLSPESIMGRMLLEQRHVTAKRVQINERTKLYEVSDPLPGALRNLLPGAYTQLVNRVAIALETAFGCTEDGKPIFRIRTFQEAAGIISKGEH